MLSKDEVQVLLVFESFKLCGNAGTKEKPVRDGTIRTEGKILSLLAVLNNGTKFEFFGKLKDIYEAAGVPFISEADGAVIPDEWLIEKGCEIAKNGIISHPKIDFTIFSID